MRALQGRAHPSTWFHLAALLGVTALANHATAQQCASDSDCGAGYQCKVTGVSGCAGSACRPGTECPPPPPCETKEYRSCVAAPCEGDADCPDPMLCHVQTYEECDEYPTTDRPSCPPDAAGCVAPQPAPVPPSECRTRTESTCRQPYELPCTADADCGGGFRCVEEVSRWCSGSGRKLADGGYERSEPECGETRSGIFHCALQELPCETDAACPTGLTCQDNYAHTTCTDAGEDDSSAPKPARDAGVRDAGRSVVAPADAVAPPTSVAADPIGAAEPVAVNPSSCTTEPAQPAKVCRPRHWSYDRDDGDTSSGSGKGDPNGEVDEEEPAAQPSPNTPPTAGAPSDGKGEGGARGRGKLKELIKRYRENRGCALAADGDAAYFELSWLAVAGVLAGASLRRKRA